MRICVGNLDYATSELELRRLFDPYGRVLHTHLPTNRETGEPRGIAFVEMYEGSARMAINALRML